MELENIKNIEQLVLGRATILQELKNIKDEMKNTKDKTKIANLERILEDTEKIILEDTEKLIANKMRAIEIINQIEDVAERVYLQEKYLNNKQNKEIAEILGYSIRNMYHIKEKALLHYLEIEQRMK